MLHARLSLVALAIWLSSGGCRSSSPPSTRPGPQSIASPPAVEPTSRPDEAAATRPFRQSRRPMKHEHVAIGADALQSGHFHGATFDDAAGGVVLWRPKLDYPFAGTWTGETVEPDAPFTELLPSWNAAVPDGGGVRFDVRVRDATTNAWSPWLYVGYWGRVTRDRRTIAFDGGKVDIDIVELTRPADAYEVRATLQAFGTDRDATAAITPCLRRLSVVTSREASADDDPNPATFPTTSPTTLPATVDLPVPFRAQGVESRSISSSVCSPTSVSMILAWAGTDRPTLEHCMSIWDDDYALFGNWNRAVQRAGSLGHEARLHRFETMDEARAMLASGQPIVASIRFKAGEFPSNLQNETAGHLIVLRGFDANGGIVCNDPASKAKGERIVYRADELAKAWLVNAGGVAYVIERRRW